MDAKPIFTIDLENFSDALHIPNDGYCNYGRFLALILMLDKYKVKSIIYKLDYIELGDHATNHVVKSHGKFHRWWENADRRPYQWLGFTGGFWFRFLPYRFIKWQVIKQGLFYIHPHDLDKDHPKLNNPFLNWKRHVGLNTVWDKLERLLTEVEFGDPS